MTEDELKAIEARAKAGVAGILSEGGGPAFDAMESCEEDVPALVAEVRRLKELIDQAADRLYVIGVEGAAGREIAKVVMTLDDALE